VGTGDPITHVDCASPCKRIELTRQALAQGIAAIGGVGQGKTFLCSKILQNMKVPYKLLTFAPKTDLVKYLPHKEVLFVPRAPPNVGRTFKWNIFLEAYLAERVFRLMPAEQVFLEFFSSLARGDERTGNWVRLAAQIIAGVALYLYRRARLVIGVGSHPADYLPTNQELLEMLMSRDDIVARAYDYLLSEKRPEYAPILAALESYLRAPRGTEMASSYETTISMVLMHLTGTGFANDGRDAFLLLRPDMKKYELEEIDAVYLYLADLSEGLKSAISAMIQTALRLLFKSYETERMDVPLIVFLDDFSTIPFIPILADLPNIGRAVGMWTMVTGQYVKQLTDYGGKYILGAFGVQFYFPTADAETRKHVAEIIAALEPKLGLLRRAGAEDVAKAGRVDASVAELETGTAYMVLAAALGGGKRSVAKVRLYRTKPSFFDLLKRL